jgi:acyl-homoserine-lactone acylase
MPLKRFFVLLLGLTLVACIVINQPVASISQTEILWDKWGVPHIYGKNSEELFKAFGWAQTQSHGNLILRLYGQARGRAAEYWGASYVASDRYVITMGIPARAQQWYDAQDKEMKGYLNAFATGINDYAQKHPTEIDDSLKAVLPISGVDILAHVQRVIHFHFLTNPRRSHLSIQLATMQCYLQILTFLGRICFCGTKRNYPRQISMLMALL